MTCRTCSVIVRCAEDVLGSVERFLVAAIELDPRVATFGDLLLESGRLLGDDDHVLLRVRVHRKLKVVQHYETQCVCVYGESDTHSGI